YIFLQTVIFRFWLCYRIYFRRTVALSFVEPVSDVFWAVCKLHISVNRHFSAFGSTIAFVFAEPLRFLL
ncbi:MAG: hypothetical protein RSG57_01795, partial [Christensenellaceae bacterium]